MPVPVRLGGGLPPGVDVRGVCLPEDLGRSGMPSSSSRSSPGSWAPGVGSGASLEEGLSSMPSKRASRSSLARRSFFAILYYTNVGDPGYCS